MAIVIKKEGAIKLAAEKGIDTIVKVAYKGESIGSATLNKKPPQSATYKQSIDVLAFGADIDTLEYCYQNIISVAKSNQIEKFVCPLLGADNNELDIEDLWTVALDALNNYGADFQIYLALDSYTNKRLESKYEKIADPNKQKIDRSLYSTPSGGHTKGSSSEQLFTAFLTQNGPIDDDLHDWLETKKKGREIEENPQALAKALAPYLERDGRSVNAIWETISGVIKSEETCNSIFTGIYKTKTKGSEGYLYADLLRTKDFITAIAIGLKLDYEEYIEVLKAGGYSPTDDYRDAVLEYCFKKCLVDPRTGKTRKYTIQQFDANLVRCDCKPLSADFENDPQSTIEEYRLYEPEGRKGRAKYKE